MESVFFGRGFREVATSLHQGNALHVLPYKSMLKAGNQDMPHTKHKAQGGSSERSHIVYDMGFGNGRLTMCRTNIYLLYISGNACRFGDKCVTNTGVRVDTLPRLADLVAADCRPFHKRQRRQDKELI